MAENNDKLSVDEILEDLKKTQNKPADFDNIFVTKEIEAVSKDTKIADDFEIEEEPDTVFGEYDSDEDDLSLPLDEEASNEDVTSEIEKEGTGEASQDLYEEENSDSESVESEDAKGENDLNVPSFKELFDEKKRVKNDVGKTRIFKKEDIEVIPADGKTRAAGQEPSSDADELEKQFNKTRQEKIDQFRLFTESITDSPIGENESIDSPSVLDSVKLNGNEDIFAAVEKTAKPKKENSKRTELIKKRNSKVYDKIDVGRVKLRLKNESDTLKMRMIVLLVAFALTLILEILKAAYTSGKLVSFETIMNSKCIIFYSISLVLAIVPFAVALSSFIYRLKNSEKLEFTNELYLSVVGAVNVFHSCVMLALRQPVEKSTLMFSLAVTFVSLLSVRADIKENEMIMTNLNTITKNERLLGIYPLTKNAEKLAGGISSSKEPNILCAGEVEVPDSFMDSSTVKDKQNSYFKVIIPLMLVFGLVSGGLAAFTYGGIGSFSVGMVSTVLLCCPAVLTTVLTSLISNVNRRLNISGCEILGYEAVEYIDDTDAIVLDTADIFTGEISHFHIINSHAGVGTLSAFKTVCAMLLNSRGVLSSEVEGLIKEQSLEIPDVDDLKYEERLGLSGWVDDKCVLLGTRQMMINHNMEVPPEHFEKPYTDEGKKVFYFAVDTQVVAMFSAEYFIGRQAKAQLEQLYKTGVILMLMTTDPNIDEEFVATTLGVDADSIKTVGSAGTQTIKKEIDKTAKQKRTGLIFRRNITGSLKVINAAFGLYDVQSLTMLIQAISIFFAFALTMVLNIIATKYFFNEWLIIGYHAIWSVLALIVTNRK